MSPKTVVLQPRDYAALEWLAQMQGAPLDVIADLLGVSQSRAYGITNRWASADAAQAGRVAMGGPGWSGPRWVWPTRETAWSMLGVDPGPWMPRPSTAAHVRAVGELRLRLTGASTDTDVWMPERLLRRRHQGQRVRGVKVPHVHDGWFTDPTGARWAVEVELSRKTDAGRLVAMVGAAVEEARACGLAGVVYFTRGPGVARGVSAAKEQLSDRDLAVDLVIRDLDEVLRDADADAVDEGDEYAEGGEVA